MGKSMHTVNKDRTICEVHREIYDGVFEYMGEGPEREEIELKIEEAFMMAKKMDARLRYYAKNYDDGWWEKESAAIRNQKHTLRDGRKKSIIK
jgi:fido (protein-threonine AMPylation protein)